MSKPNLNNRTSESRAAGAIRLLRERASLTPAMRGSLTVLVMRVTGIALQAGVLVFLTRAMRPDALGVYASVYALTAIARLLGPIGFDQLAMRGLLIGEEEAGPWDVAALIGVVNFGIAAAIGLAVVVMFPHWKDIDLIVAAAMIPSFALSGLFAGFIRGTGGNVSAQWPESILLPALVCVFITAFSVNHQLNLTRALLGLFSAAWITTLTYSLLTTRRPGGGLKRMSLSKPVPLIKEGGSILSALTFTALSARAPMLLALPLLGPAGAAVMEVANRFGTLATVISSSVAITYSPIFAKMAIADDRRAQRRSLFHGAAFSAAGAIAIAMILAVAFPYATGTIFPLFYSKSYSVLIVLSLATTVNACFGLASNLMFMRGDAAKVRRASTVQVFLVYGSAIPLAAFIGPLGIAVAGLMGTAVRDGWLFRKVLQELSLAKAPIAN